MKKKKKRQKKIEWSKFLTSITAFIFGIYGMWCGIEYYAICKLAIKNGMTPPEPELAITCVSVVIATILSYCLYQGYLKGSLNKHGLTVDPKTGIIKAIARGDVSGIFEEVIDDIENEINSEEERLENED